MSRISQDFINNVGLLYEQINTQETDFLNEESEYYNEEAAELVENIILSISLSMFSEGYTAEAFLKFLANSDEDTILEKYLSSDVSLLSEETIYTEFVEEQYQIIERAGLLRLIGRGLSAAGKGIVSGAKATRAGVKKGVEKVATAGVEKRVGKQFAKSTDPSRTAAAVEKVAKTKATKAGITAPTGPLSPKQSTDLLKQARVSQAVKGVKSAAKNALLAGTGVLAGYAGAKLGGAGKKPTEAPKLADKKPVVTKPADVTAPASPKLAPSNGGKAPAKPAADSDTAVNKKYDELRKKDPAAAEKYGLEQWKKKFPNLAKNLNPDGTQKGTGQSEMEKSAEDLRKMSNRSLQRQGELMGGPEGPGKIDTKDADQALKAQQERDAARRKKEMEKATSSMKESYEPYEVLLEYLMSGGHADTIEEAHYIMLEMDASAVRAVMEEYEDYLLAEEVSEWVDGLLDEGYDLSEYSWDTVVEYYVTEAKYGTAKGRKALAKKVRAGKDVGKKGAGFEEIVDKASGKYGKERATKIAAAAMWKTYGGKKGKTRKEY